MTAPRPIVWTDVALLPDVRQELELHAEVDARREDTLEGIERADAIIAGSRFPGTAATFRLAVRTRVVARVGMGFDRIDLAAATADGICTINTPDAPTESTAEFAIALMLATARRIVPAAAALAAGQWEQGPPLLGRDLSGRTLGLVGCGRIGRRVAEIAHALGLTVQAFDPFAASLPPGIGRAPSLETLLATADIVSVHVPLSPDTHRLLGAAAFAAIKPGAVLINTARGPIVDESALLAALDDGRISAAGLDVWDPEPPKRENPLLRHPRVVATPHMAAFTHEGKRRSHRAAVAGVLAVLQGERPAGLLNPSVWPSRRGSESVP